MTMHKGWKLRRMVSVEPGYRYVGVGVADCGHLVVRLHHLAVGQRVFCGKCADLS